MQRERGKFDMMNTSQPRSNNNPKRQTLWRWVSKFSWLLFLKGTISFQGLGWEIELEYQPLLEDRTLTELVKK